MIPEPFVWMAAGLAGAIAHEAAHWLVWRVAGRDPRFDLWKLIVCPRAGPTTTTAADRVAAAAPYALGLLAIAASWWFGSWPAFFFGVFAIQIPSRSDVSTVLGQVEWRFDVS